MWAVTRVDTDFNYKPRLIDARLQEYLKIFGAVTIDGPRCCGKTSTGEHAANSKILIADGKSESSTVALAKIDATLLWAGKQDAEFPLLIDEWQEVPAIFDTVRFDVDKTQKKGRFILTGSAVTEDTRHSGAGRFGSLKMSTLSLYEMGKSTGTVSLRAIFDDPSAVSGLAAPCSLEDLALILGAGGWPASLTLPADVDPASASQRIAEEYLSKVCSSDLKKVGGFKRTPNPTLLRKVLHVLAECDSSVVSITDLQNRLNEKGVTIARNTLSLYIDILKKLFLISDIEGISFIDQSPRKMLTSPKRRFVDPSLLLAALEKNPKELKNDIKTFTMAFDNLCCHDMQVYAMANNAKLYHLKDGYGWTADSVLKLDDGRWAIFKHVLSSADVDDAAAKLVKIKKAFENFETPISYCGVICGTGFPAAFMRPDAVVVLPITAIAP